MVETKLLWEKAIRSKINMGETNLGLFFVKTEKPQNFTKKENRILALWDLLKEKASRNEINMGEMKASKFCKKKIESLHWESPSWRNHTLVWLERNISIDKARDNI